MNCSPHRSVSTISIIALASLLSSTPAFAKLPCTATQAETVRSDKGHYALGETARIAGSGFAPSCIVRVRVTRPDLSVTTGEPIVTDAAGSFAYSYTVEGPAGRFYNFDVIGDDQIAGNLFSAGAVVWTDKGDYHPGETVQIRGLGWQPGEVVRLDLHENNGPRPDLEFSASADASGGILNTDFTPALHHRDIKFTLTATGLESGRTAFNYFKDAGTFVQVIGTNSQTLVTNSSLTVTVPAAGVTAGNSIIVSLSVGSFAGAIGCSDPNNGAYTLDTTSPDAGDSRLAVVSRHNVVALASGDVITCTYPQFSGISLVSALEFSGLTAAPFDTSAADTSTNSGSASSGLTAVTSQADELVFGLVRLGVVPAQGFTPATAGGNPVENPYNPPYTTAGAVTHGGNSQGIEPWFRFVSSTGQYEMNGTVTGTGGWRIAVATYKVGETDCTPTAADDTTCDGVDDDCSGGIDDDYDPVTNTCGVGACASSGTPSSCTGGVETLAGACTPGSPTGVSESICNGVDDDCDASTDEDYSPTINECGTGACASSGTPSSCTGGVETPAGDCTPGIPGAEPESTCNGIDDDCDASTDEDYSPTINECGIGECASSGTPSSCTGGVETPAGACTPESPTSEICDGADNDCDGIADESDGDENIPVACSDGNACTLVDTCTGGQCVGSSSPDCNDDNPCTADSCDVQTGDCLNPPQPRTDCLSPGKARFLVYNPIDPTRGGRRMVFNWRDGDASPVNFFGDPTTTTDYTLCVFDGIGGGEFAEASRLEVAAGPLWRATSRGFRLRDKDGTNDGVNRVVLRSLTSGRPHLVVRAGHCLGCSSSSTSSTPFPVPVEPGRMFDQDPMMAVQLINEFQDRCWLAEFNSSKPNTDSKFSARIK